MRCAHPVDTRLPFLNGVYISVDAIPGAVVVVDGPYCVSTKALLQMAHNLRSDLLPPWGRARVVPTLRSSGMEEVMSLALDRRQAIEAVFREVAAWPETDVVFATSFDFLQLLNFPLEEVARAGARGKLVCHIPSRSLGGDWLEGYASTCAALAREIPLSPRPRPDTVALVGHLMDRTEPDQLANVAELRRLLGGLGLDIAAIWLSGVGIQDLAAVAEAELIVALPYAREAARILGERLRIGVVECDLPVGLAATEAFLANVGEWVGRAARAAELAERESAAAVRDVQALVDRCVSGLPVVLRFADPVLREGLRAFCRDVGALAVDVEAVAPEDPGSGAVVPEGLEHAVVLSATLGHSGLALPHIGFGYPNLVDHPITPRPFMGPSGFRVLVERLAAAVLRREAGW